MADTNEEAEAQDRARQDEEFRKECRRRWEAAHSVPYKPK